MTAICKCDAGFVDDGLARCSKCADPLFKFPDCQTRGWIIEEPEISCKGLEYNMPKTLYDKKGDGSKVRLQGDDGVLKWAQRYRLIDNGAMRKSAKFKFMVPTNSVFRLFVDTVQSGALVKYRLLGDSKAELLTSVGSTLDVDEDGFVDSGSEL